MKNCSSGKIWRTGANESTNELLFKPINIDGKKLDVGTYTIFTITQLHLYSKILCILI